MDEFISKQNVLDYLNGYLHSLGNGGADTLLFDRGQRRALINAIQDISAIKAADVQPVNQFISVNDRLPNCYEKVLVASKIEFEVYHAEKDAYTYIHTPDIEVGWLGENGKWSFMFDCADRYKITHWMPLPKLPKDGEENGK